MGNVGLDQGRPFRVYPHHEFRRVRGEDVQLGLALAQHRLVKAFIAEVLLTREMASLTGLPIIPHSLQFLFPVPLRVAFLVLPKYPERVSAPSPGT